MNQPIPDSVLTQHMAFLGKTGSGKTSTAKLAVEQIVRSDPSARVCILDAIKSDWWGLTSSADGKSAGLPFVILGGPRGHVPLHDSAGAAIGELVATGRLPLSIIDMADFGAGGLQKFFNDFAPALMKRMRGVVYLVLEEAHEFAPKERSGIGAESMAIHWAKKLATAGRSKGIRLMVLTQRTQALHNALLGSCDTMIAHRLTAPADQEPVKKWLKANVDKVTFEKVSSSLASLKTGSGWICSGEAQVTELVRFPLISTYDNSATPTSQSGAHAVTMAPVDQDKLRAIIGDAVKESEANDPKVLKAEIARLTRELSAKPTAAPAVVDHEAIETARDDGYDRGLAEGLNRGENRAKSALNDVRDRLSDALAIAGAAIDSLDSPMPAQRPPRAVVAPPVHQGSTRPARSSVASSLPGPQQRILNSLATWRDMGKASPSNAQVAWLANYSPSSTSYTNPRGALKSAGLIDYPAGDHLSMTPTGEVAATPIVLSSSLLNFVLSNLPGPEARILRSIADYHPGPIDNATAAEGANYSSTSTSYTNPRGALKTKDLITYPSNGLVRAADWLFTKGAR